MKKLYVLFFISHFLFSLNAAELNEHITSERNTAATNNRAVINVEPADCLEHNLIEANNLKPDLTISNTNAHETSSLPSSTYIASCRVQNTGAALASSSYIGFYLSTNTTYGTSDTYLGKRYVTSLSPGNYSAEYLNITLSVNLSPGTYYILFRADMDNTVSESSESNNVSYFQITVPEKQPDLRVTNQTATPATATAGSTINANCRVYNSGNATAEYSFLRYYLSTNATYSTNDTYLGYDYVWSLSAGSYSQEAISFTLPTSLSPGTYYILYQADSNDRIDEISENNNLASFQIVVTSNAKPDLRVSYPSITSTTIQVGTSVTAFCRVDNDGNASSSYSLLRYYLSTNATYSTNDTYLGYDYVSSLSAGNDSYEALPFSLPPSLSPGTYYILYRADADDYIDESNENNNVSSLQIIVTANTSQPDLRISNQTATPTTAQAGSTINTNCRVYNDGNALAGYSYLRYYLSTNTTYSSNDTYLGYDYVSSLTAGNYGNESHAFNLPASLAAGTYYILYQADYTDRIDESNENNNLAYQQIVVTANTSLPDLRIANQTATATAPVGTAINGSCRVYNNGNTSQDHSYIRFYLSANTTYEPGDQYLGYRYVKALSTGEYSQESFSSSVPTTFTPGTYYILYRADYYDDVEESNENNNVGYVQIVVTANTSLPDLSLSNITATETSVPVGGSVNVTGHVYNNGGIKISKLSYLRFYFSTDSNISSDDTYIGDEIVGYISPGTFHDLTVNLNLASLGSLSAGTYYILCDADFNNRIDESNENNNEAHFTIQITLNSTPPDLIVGNKSATITSTVGSTVYISCGIKNIGTTSASGSFIKYYLSNNTTYSTNDTYLGEDVAMPLSANSTWQEYFNFQMPSVTPGTYYILYVADANNHVTESNESNNVAYTILNIGATPFTGDAQVNQKKIPAAENLLLAPDYTLEVFPNPASITTASKLKISGQQPIGQVKMTILNQAGKAVCNNTLTVEGKTEIIRLPVIREVGTYFITVQSEFGLHTAKLLVIE